MHIDNSEMHKDNSEMHIDNCEMHKNALQKAEKPYTKVRTLQHK
ncbi:hypothetical protein HMPREF9999_01401 [Alloprevotella sp. oral taxon 473 str. F0040]|nr:hypothetical protein HMPREF9999_01401 [Alloprevotella sp. oral taxon 473 str. F0040]